MSQHRIGASRIGPSRIGPSRIGVSHIGASALVVAATVVALLAPAGATVPERVRHGTDAPEPKLEVLDRGASPRTQLRFAVPVGTTQILTMRMYSNFGQRQGDQVLSGGSPNTTFTLSATVSSVTAAGDLVVDLVYEDVEATDDGSPTFEQYEEAIQPIKGLAATLTMSPTGAHVDSNFVVPEDLDDTARQVVEQLVSQAEQLAVPLPEPAVGKGARWTVSTEVEVIGFTVEQTTTFTLDRIRGSRIWLSTETEQHADRQTTRIPGTIGKTTLLSSEGEGRGTSEYDLANAPMITGGDASVELRQKFRSGGQAFSQSLQLAMFVNERR